MQPDESYPLVSIIMPVRNEARYIRRSQGSVLNQDYPSSRMEVLVVDGMSEDGTRDIVRSLAHAHPDIDVRLLDNPEQITPTALNIGLGEAKGDVITILGGHCEIAREYIRDSVDLLCKTGADCVGGTLVTLGETRTAKAIALAQSSYFGVGAVAFRTGRKEPTYVGTVAFGVYRRDAFERVGNFDEELVRNQDDEFNYRLTRAGGRILLDPAVNSVYFSRASLDGLWRQYFQYGYYKVRVIQKLGAVPSWRHLVPASFVLGVIVSLVGSVITLNPMWAGLVLGPYLAANLAASTWAAIHGGGQYLPLLPLAFLIIHGAYGCGFLAGLFQFGFKIREKE